VGIGATIPYHQRANKHVERLIFIDLLQRVDRWRSIAKYLYVGFGGIYFEDFKLLHMHFGIDSMISIEQEDWLLPRQEINIPYRCIKARRETSSEFIQSVEAVKRDYSGTDNLLIWLDYAKASELPDQLKDIRALVPKLEANDVLKVTLSANPRWLGKGPSSELQNRLDNLKNKVGAEYLGDGLTEEDVQNDNLPIVLLNALKRKIAEGMMESHRLSFQPLGCYVYRDSVTMLTMTGIVLHRAEEKQFLARAELDTQTFQLSSLNWELQRIEVPDMSLQEKIILDKLLFEKSPAQIQDELSFRFAEDPDESIALIENYKRVYRYYPNYQRVYL
jgi:putative O-methyltransferase